MGDTSHAIICLNDRRYLRGCVLCAYAEGTQYNWTNPVSPESSSTSVKCHNKAIGVRPHKKSKVIGQKKIVLQVKHLFWLEKSSIPHKEVTKVL